MRSGIIATLGVALVALLAVVAMRHNEDLASGTRSGKPVEGPPQLAMSGNWPTTTGPATGQFPEMVASGTWVPAVTGWDPYRPPVDHSWDFAYGELGARAQPSPLPAFSASSYFTFDTVFDTAGLRANYPLQYRLESALAPLDPRSLTSITAIVQRIEIEVNAVGSWTENTDLRRIWGPLPRQGKGVYDLSMRSWRYTNGEFRLTIRVTTATDTPLDFLAEYVWAGGGNAWDIPDTVPAFWWGTPNIGWATFQGLWDKQRILFFHANYAIEVDSNALAAVETIPIAQELETWLVTETTAATAADVLAARLPLARAGSPSPWLDYYQLLDEQVVVPANAAAYGVRILRLEQQPGGRFFRCARSRRSSPGSLPAISANSQAAAPSPWASSPASAPRSGLSCLRATPRPMPSSGWSARPA